MGASAITVATICVTSWASVAIYVTISGPLWHICDHLRTSVIIFGTMSGLLWQCVWPSGCFCDHLFDHLRDHLLTSVAVHALAASRKCAADLRFMPLKSSLTEWLILQTHLFFFVFHSRWLSRLAWLTHSSYQILATRSWLSDLGNQLLATRSWLPDSATRFMLKSSWNNSPLLPCYPDCLSE